MTPVIRFGVEGPNLTGYNGRTVNEHGDPPPSESAVCERCEAVGASDDNFCRRCGLSFQDDVYLPSVRERNLPAVAPPSVPATVVKGAAFVAAGKIAEMLVRRMVRGAFRRGTSRAKTPARAKKAELVPREERLPEEGHVVSETFLLRRVRIRR